MEGIKGQHVWCIWTILLYLAKQWRAPSETGGAPSETGGAPSETGGAPSETGGSTSETGGSTCKITRSRFEDQAKQMPDPVQMCTILCLRRVLRWILEKLSVFLVGLSL